MSRSFDCPNCGMPHKEIAVPSYTWGVFVSNEQAEAIALEPGEYFERDGWRPSVQKREAVRCSECGWIGAFPILGDG